MDDNKDRFRYDGPTPQNAGDDLARMAEWMTELRDFLIGLTSPTSSIVTVTQDTLRGLAQAEEAVSELLAKKWDECQDVLRESSDSQLAETETEWMGEKIPTFFSRSDGSVINPDEFRALCERIKARRLRTPTNPSTLISTGQL